MRREEISKSTDIQTGCCAAALVALGGINELLCRVIKALLIQIGLDVIEMSTLTSVIRN